MKKLMRMATVLMLGLSGSSLAIAEDKACMLEGSFSMMGVSIDIKDCMQNEGLDAAKFKEACSSLSQMGAAMGGQPAKITYMAACPQPAQGSCTNLFGQLISAFYYKRDAETLAGSKIGCEQQGGTWK